jgi:hypothetical protein
MLVGLFYWALWPRTARSHVEGIFPRPSRHRSEVPDTVLDRAVLPVFSLCGRLLPSFRLLHQGRIQIYLLYFVVIATILLLIG